MATLIAIEELTKLYRMGDTELHALAGVSLTIDQGEFVAIMGASGSGKSTLMNLLGCLDRPTSGSYFLDGRDVARLSKDELARARLQLLGFVFQGFHLLARTTAVENVELPLLYAGVPSRERERRAREALARVGLAGREGHTASQLSGGQQQRVAIARALVNKPEILLADEPTGNLDSDTASEIIDLLNAHLRENRTTLLMVTHDEELARRCADRILRMKDGQVVC